MDRGGRPDEDAIIAMFTALSNWGRWGPDDASGTLNLIDAHSRLRGAAAVSVGRAVSCGLTIAPGPQAGDLHGAPQRSMVRTGTSAAQAQPGSVILPGARYDAAAEYLGLPVHGPNMTHLDSLSHTVWDGALFNGHPASESVTADDGARVGSVELARDGVVSRGVLLDAAGDAGVPWLEPGTAVDRRTVERLEISAGVEVQAGDVVLLRTGFGGKRSLHGPTPITEPWSGWCPSALPWMRERDVAVVGSDGFNEATPSGYDALPLPIHAVGQAAIGLWLIDGCDLEELAAACRERGRWDFLFVAAPLRIRGGTGSPINPVALI